MTPRQPLSPSLSRQRDPALPMPLPPASLPEPRSPPSPSPTAAAAALTNCAVAPPLPTGLDGLAHQRQRQLPDHRHPNRCRQRQTAYTVTATNASGDDATPATVSITVAPARPDLADAFAANLTVGDRAAITFTNKGGGSLTSCTVAPPLPSGLDVSRTGDNGSCRITGTPRCLQQPDHLHSYCHQCNGQWHSRGFHHCRASAARPG